MADNFQSNFICLCSSEIVHNLFQKIEQSTTDIKKLFCQKFDITKYGYKLSGGLNIARIFLEDSKWVKTGGKQFHCTLNKEVCKGWIDKITLFLHPDSLKAIPMPRRIHSFLKTQMEPMIR